MYYTLLTPDDICQNIYGVCIRCWFISEELYLLFCQYNIFCFWTNYDLNYFYELCLQEIFILLTLLTDDMLMGTFFPPYSHDYNNDYVCLPSPLSLTKN